MSAPAPQASRQGEPPGEDPGFRLSIVTALTVGFAALMAVTVAATAWVVLDAAQRNTFDLLSGKSRAAGCEDEGEHILRGLSAPMRVFRLSC